MFDDILKAKVNREVGRINGELCDLKELEESTRIRRARRTERRRASAACPAGPSARTCRAWRWLGASRLRVQEITYLTDCTAGTLQSLHFRGGRLTQVRTMSAKSRSGMVDGTASEVVRSSKDSARKVLPPKSKSRISNGADLLPGIDGRSLTARRYRDLLSAVLVDQGGDRCSEARRQLVRRFAAAACLAEQLEARLVNGETISIQEHATLSSTLVRLASRIGIDRRQKDISPTLSDYLAADSAEVEDVSDTDVDDERTTGHAKAAEAASKPAPTMALDSALSKTGPGLPDLDEDIARDAARVCKGEVL